MNYKNLYSLIQQIEEYEKQVGEYTDDFERDFALWLLSKRKRPAKQEQGSHKTNIEGSIGMMLAFLGRYLDYYSKRLFKRSLIYSIADFGMMMSLFSHTSLTKTELIKSNLLEKPTGMEVIKRMLRQGLVIEKPLGKKNKIVCLTELGISELKKIMIHIDLLAKHVTGDLTHKEKEHFLEMMARLHIYHQPIFNEQNDDRISEILKLNLL